MSEDNKPRGLSLLEPFRLASGAVTGLIVGGLIYAGANDGLIATVCGAVGFLGGAGACGQVQEYLARPKVRGRVHAQSPSADHP